MADTVIRPVQNTGQPLHTGVKPFLDRLWPKLAASNVTFALAVHPYDGGNPMDADEWPLHANVTHRRCVCVFLSFFFWGGGLCVHSSRVPIAQLNAQRLRVAPYDWYPSSKSCPRTEQDLLCLLS